MNVKTLSITIIFVSSAVVAVAALAQAPRPQGARAGTHAVEIPALDARGAPQEKTELVSTSHQTIARIVLRKKTVLPTHQTDDAVVVQALSGSGVVEVAGEKMRLDARHLVLLAPNVPHSVTPETDTLELLLVRNHVGGRGPRPHAH